MSPQQQITLIGIVATEPRFLSPTDRVPFCSFRLASTERRYDASQQQWSDGETSWFTVNAFRSLARHAHASFHKGERVIVSGRIRVRDWERDGRRGTSVEIDADALGHELRWGTSAFTRATFDSPSAGSNPDDSGVLEPGTSPSPSPVADGFVPVEVSGGTEASPFDSAAA